MEKDWYCIQQSQIRELKNQIEVLKSEQNKNMIELVRIKIEDYKITKVCEHCYQRGYVDSNCKHCGGKGTYRKTMKRWVIAKHTEEIDKIDRDENGELRFWTSMSEYFPESNKTVHFTEKDAQMECNRRNKKLEGEDRC